ncbi:hypothetical protein DFH08DRAFT_810402 [Mycena albidolilacea]|uniref:Uncharacterized protein n=1 Tax=Mycena albidolilacea TaxID=1033008 RepID=A0AAD6ZY03_9AGAR|nr:hypothetical protein DFH08DRAFT_810402 [Mycena albidolilacea]
MAAQWYLKNEGEKGVSIAGMPSGGFKPLPPSCNTLRCLMYDERVTAMVHDSLGRLPQPPTLVKAPKAYQMSGENDETSTLESKLLWFKLKDHVKTCSNLEVGSNLNSSIHRAPRDPMPSGFALASIAKFKSNFSHMCPHKRSENTQSIHLNKTLGSAPVITCLLETTINPETSENTKIMGAHLCTLLSKSQPKWWAATAPRTPVSAESCANQITFVTRRPKLASCLGGPDVLL